jgi:hypothetical protein
LDRNFRSIAAKPQDFSRDEPETFRLAPENRSLCAGNMPLHTASTDDLHVPGFRAGMRCHEPFQSFEVITWYV